MTTTTSRAETPIHHPGGATYVRVAADPDARRARVHLDVSTTPGAPVLRPMLLSQGPAEARISLVPDGALLLAGDRITVTCEVGPGARLDIVEPAGTVAYDMRGGEASWTVCLRLHAGATLVWHGEPFVAAAGSVVRRTTSADLDAGARLLMRETLVLGRHGEPPGRLHVRTQVRGRVPLLVEDLLLDPVSLRPGVLGGHRVLATVLALGTDIGPTGQDDHRFDLDPGGALWRRLGTQAHRAGLEDAWRLSLATLRESGGGHSASEE